MPTSDEFLKRRTTAGFLKGKTTDALLTRSSAIEGEVISAPQQPVADSPGAAGGPLQLPTAKSELQAHYRQQIEDDFYATVALQRSTALKHRSAATALQQVYRQSAEQFVVGAAKLLEIKRSVYDEELYSYTAAFIHQQIPQYAYGLHSLELAAEDALVRQLEKPVVLKPLPEPEPEPEEEASGGLLTLLLKVLI